jgi:hypothetical protein
VLANGVAAATDTYITPLASLPFFLTSLASYLSPTPFILLFS